MTAIEWTDQTWNPTTGCDRVSPGCDHCYAMTLAPRLKAMGQAKYQNDGDPRTSGPGFGVTQHAATLRDPLTWRKPRRVFVNSMSDLFHDSIPDEFIARVFAVMAATPRHTYQVLTKRHARMRSFLRDECRCGQGHAPSIHLRSAMAWAASKANPDRIPGLPDNAEHDVYFEAGWPLPNVWLGVSAENQRWAGIRIPALLETPAAVRFVSAEPLLGPIDLDATAPGWWARFPDEPADGRHGGGIDWVIVGGESGPGARPLEVDWVRSIVKQCQEAGAAPFVKQLGSVWAHAAGADGKGGNSAHWPEDLRVRHYPPAER